jgi:metal-responsive CopG/Arc/MetJ family transcriptional regulator
MARRKIVNLNLDPELLERLDQLVESRRSAGHETNRSKVARELLTTALRLEEIR